MLLHDRRSAIESEMRMNVRYRRLFRFLRLYPSAGSTRLGSHIFPLALLTFLACQFLLSTLPYILRASPPEVDDAYCYILKAAQMASDFLQRSPALSDLKTSLSESSDPNLAWIRYRESHRAFAVYHPLHSLLLASLKLSGLSWEESYRTLWILGQAVLVLCTALFLRSLVGPAGSATALILMSFVVFPGQGTHHAIPSTLALSLGMLAWTIAINSSRAKWQLAVLLTALLLTMHPTGKLYSLILLGLLISGEKTSWCRLKRFCLALSALLLATSFALPYLTDALPLRTPADPPPAGWTYFHGVWLNLYVTKEALLTFWPGTAPGVLLLAFSLTGLFGLSQDKLRKSLVLIVLTGALLAASQLYCLPRYPGDLSRRLLVPALTLLFGFAGRGIVLSLRALTAHLKLKSTGRRSPLIIQGAALMSVLSLPMAVWHLAAHLPGWKQTQQDLLWRFPYVLEPDQVELALSNSKPQDRILYGSEEAMHFYLAHGAERLGAAFLPALIPPAAYITSPGLPGFPYIDLNNLPRNALSQIPSFQHYVGLNPLIGSLVPQNRTLYSGLFRPDTGKGLGFEEGVLILPGYPLKITHEESHAFQLTSISFRAPGYGAPGDSALGAALRPGPSRGQLTLTSRWGKSTTLELLSDKHSGLENLVIPQEINPLYDAVFSAAPGSSLLLTSLRLDQQQRLNWPWHSGLEVEVVPPLLGAIRSSAHFDLEFLPTVEGTKPRVLSDSGSLILVKYERAQ